MAVRLQPRPPLRRNARAKRGCSFGLRGFGLRGVTLPAFAPAALGPPLPAWRMGTARDPPPSPMSQFTFLQPEFPEVFGHAAWAEAQALADPRGSALYASVIGIVYKKVVRRTQLTTLNALFCSLHGDSFCSEI